MTNTAGAIVGIPPRVTPETEQFWAAAAEGKLIIERCCACGLDLFPPRGVCRRCGSMDVEGHVVDAPGVVYSYTVNHQRWFEGMDVPYGLVLVEFLGYPGVRILGRTDPAEPERLTVGMPVALRFVVSAAGHPVPIFAALGPMA